MINKCGISIRITWGKFRKLLWIAGKEDTCRFFAQIGKVAEQRNSSLSSDACLFHAIFCCVCVEDSPQKFDVGIIKVLYKVTYCFQENLSQEYEFKGYFTQVLAHKRNKTKTGQIHSWKWKHVVSTNIFSVMQSVYYHVKCKMNWQKATRLNKDVSKRVVLYLYTFSEYNKAVIR